MNVLVTGGAGFIGANFLHYSVPRRPDMHFINVDSLTYAGNLASLEPIATAPNYHFEHADITDATAMNRLFEQYKPHLVVHFAAESHVDRSIHGPAAFMKTNIEGTFNLLEAARKLHAQGHELRFHHVSTDEVYGSLGDTGLFTEDTPYAPSSPYSASKASSDHLVRAYHHTYGLRTKITNCSNNYGPYQFPEKLIPLMLLNCLEGKALPIYGQGINVRDWLYVTDHCAAIWAVIEHGQDGRTYNVGGNSEQRNIDVVDALCRIVAKKTGQSVDALLSLKTYVKDRPGHDHRYAIDASRIKAECGWAPTETFETGLEKTVAWYLENPQWVDGIRSGEYRRWLDTNYADRPIAHAE